MSKTFYFQAPVQTTAIDMVATSSGNAKKRQKSGKIWVNEKCQEILQNL